MDIIGFINSNWDKIIWGVLFFIDTVYLFSYGIIENWQQQRAKRGIIRIEEINVPINYRVNNKMIHIVNCIKLFLLSTIITGSIFLIYIGTTSVKFDSIIAFITTAMALFAIVFAFVEAPIDREEFKREKKYEYLLIIFGRIKAKLINRIVDREYYNIRKKNKKYLMKWTKKNDVKIVALVNRLNKDLFMKRIPSDVTDEALQELKSSLRPIAESYFKEDGELYERLESLFDEDLIKTGMRICDINEYLIKHELLCSDLDKVKIEKELKKNLKSDDNKPKTKPKQSDLDILTNLLIKIMDTDNSTDNSKVI